MAGYDIKPSKWLSFDFRELVRFRELFMFMVWRDIKVKVIVEILDSSGARICSIYDSDSGFELKNVFGNTHISLELKDIRFYPGRYHISVLLCSEILNFKCDTYDEIENAISFDVENHLISNRTLTRNSGLLLLTPGWKVY
jgi:hypothetical protein